VIPWSTIPTSLSVIRNSDFGFPSEFGIRISDLGLKEMDQEKD